MPSPILAVSVGKDTFDDNGAINTFTTFVEGYSETPAALIR